MPIYEYQCKACYHQLEALQKISAAPLLDCPRCDQPTLKKLVSAASFKLKGSGWYETDFKHNGRAPNKENAGQAEAAASGQSKPPAASDSKPSGADGAGKKAAPANAAAEA
ncbi:MAG: zinc ribbon domain-containing protein [Pseudomonadales bacterium]|nr:zinc ribbon domain-containing protein [Gammaproteobacteria bacterium]NNL56731.1 zinc ribbon domain-containing protein [Pseudomonadales bacterium]